MDKIKGGLKMGLGMEGVGWGEPTGVPEGPLGGPGCPWGPRGSKTGGFGVRGGWGRALIHGFPISPLGSPILRSSLIRP